MNYDRLHFGYELTDWDSLSVYDERTVSIDGIEFEMAVIGSSHAVRAPAVGFAEIASCDPGTVGDCSTIDLETGVERERRHDADDVACRTAIRVDSITQFPADESFDLRYDFAEHAVTAIAVGDRGYETWHTYPEHGCAVYTETEFDRVGSERPLAENLASL